MEEALVYWTNVTEGEIKMAEYRLSNLVQSEFPLLLIQVDSTTSCLAVGPSTWR